MPCTILARTIFAFALFDSAVGYKEGAITRKEMVAVVIDKEGRGSKHEGRGDAEHSSHQSSLQEYCGSYLTEADSEVAGNAMNGFSGGHWSPCTHLKVYGLNFAPFVARFLAYQLAPKTALEFGCGLGTTSDFVARFSNATVTCVEPEKTLGELIMSLRSDMRGNGALQQLALNVFSEEPKVQNCVSSGALKSDLVFSFEVAEHIPAKFRPSLVSTLVNATGKWLVFSAARPGQLGTGHISESMLTRDEWQALFEAGGLVHMPKLSLLARNTAYPARGYDLYGNMLVFRNPSHIAEDTDIPHEKLAKFGNWWGPAGECPSCEKYSDGRDPREQEYFTKNDEGRALHLKAFYEGSNSALWPELTDKEASVRNGEVCSEHNQGSLLQNGIVSEEIAFTSAWGSHFHHQR